MALVRTAELVVLARTAEMVVAWEEYVAVVELALAARILSVELMRLVDVAAAEWLRTFAENDAVVSSVAVVDHANA